MTAEAPFREGALDTDTDQNAESKEHGGGGRTAGADGRRVRRRLRSSRRASVLVATVAVLLLQTALTAASVAAVHGGTYGRRNLEASYHVLLTLRALRVTPLSQSLGLPVTTLGQANDAWIPWGAAVPNRFGEWVYTSFPPLGFWAPFIASLPLAHPGLVFLVVFNGVLAAATAVLVLLLTRRVILDAGRPTAAGNIGGVLAGALYVLSSEAMQSQGVVYWPQSLNEVLLVGIAFAAYQRACGRMPRTGAPLVGLLAVASCYTEWTGFVLALLGALVCVAVRPLRTRLRGIAVALLAAAAVAAGLLLTQFAVSVGIGPAFEAWTARADDRATSEILPLVQGWALSAGGTALAATLVLIVAAVVRPTRDRLDPSGLVAFALLTVPLVENLLLQQHAAQFSFDRLKLVAPLAVLAGVVLGELGPRARIATGVAALAVGAFFGVQMQTADEALYASWPATDLRNHVLEARAARTVDLRCATLGSSDNVRGYLNLLFGRGIHEFTTLSAVEATAPAGSCGTVYIVATNPFADLPAISSIEIVRPDVAPVTVAP